jgi:predicted AlkP superfamily phosphohydrolase/phosphomutase
VVFDTPDRIQHVTPEPGDLATSPIGRYYIEHDRFLGKVISRLPENTPMLVFSDHGFSTFERAVDLNRWLANEGYLAVDEVGFEARAPGSSGELYQYVDWSKTQAYAVGFAGIFLNLEGREGKGIVPDEEAGALAKEIATKLAALTDDGDKQVVKRVFLRDELYSGPHAKEAPDVVVGLAAGYRGSWQTAVGGLATQVLADNDQPWQRDHIVDASLVPGVLITNFPVQDKTPHVYDLAPTVLSLLGLPVPEEMEGTPLQSRETLARR